MSSCIASRRFSRQWSPGKRHNDKPKANAVTVDCQWMLVELTLFRWQPNRLHALVMFHGIDLLNCHNGVQFVPCNVLAYRHLLSSFRASSC